jgi:predicted ATPase
VRALEVARRQGARWWELRATTSAARLRGMKREKALARRMLAPVVDGFTEGRDTPDFREARALLATLG